jgi:uncharacterized DUF497 family protein
MRITFDPAKRARTLADRGLDFADAEFVFEGVTRLSTKTHVETMASPASSATVTWTKRMVVVGYTPRGDERHVFSMRKANEREKARIAPLLEV